MCSRSLGVLLVLRGEPRSTQPWSHLKQLLRNGHNHESLGRRCVLAVWICALSPHPPRCNRTGQTGRPPAQSPRRRITRGFHIKAQAELTHCIRLMSTGKGKEEEEIGERRSGVQDHKRRSGDRRAIGRAQSRSRTNDKAEKRKKVMPGLRVSVW